MEFSTQEYWSGLPFPSPGDLPNLGVEPKFPALQADSLPLSHWGSPFNAYYILTHFNSKAGSEVSIQILLQYVGEELEHLK